MRPARQAGWTIGLFMTACVCWLPASAQNLRDPTLAPWGTGSGAGTGATPARGIHGPLSVLVVNGQPYLVLGTRLYAEGQKLGAIRIERITETEVWLREGSSLRKISNFVGIQRRSVTSAAAASACGAGTADLASVRRSSKTPAPVVPCDGGQP